MLQTKKETYVHALNLQKLEFKRYSKEPIKTRPGKQFFRTAIEKIKIKKEKINYLIKFYIFFILLLFIFLEENFLLRIFKIHNHGYSTANMIKLK